MYAKKLLSVLGLAVLLLTGCQESLVSEEDVLRKVREELPLSEAETIPIQPVGSVQQDSLRLIWFMTGNEYQNHRYFPLEFQVAESGALTFSHRYQPMNRGTDLSVLLWQRGYCFLINNEGCQFLSITDTSGNQHIIEITHLPFLYYLEEIPEGTMEYTFLDANGHEI